MSEKTINTSPSNLIKHFSSVNNDQNNNNNFSVNHNNSKQTTNASKGFNRGNSDNSGVCAKCGLKVYQVERVGPVNEVIFHKGCFKCLKCGQMLTLKNYFTNPLDASDKQVYCVKDCPKVPMGGIDARALGIRAAMMAPSANMNAANSDVIRWFGNVPKIGADAMHIREALSAQSEFQRKNLFQNKHNFPFWIKSKEKLLEYQKELEREQKKEEDRLVEAFQEERIYVARVVDNEINEEWQKNLRKITENYERQNRRKESVSYSREIDELNKTMTLKKKSKIAVMTMKLQSTARERTADLVKIQSEQMLSLLRKKKQELNRELTTSENSEEFIEAFSGMTLPAEAPDAHPPRIRKRDLYHDPTVFNELDEYVFQVAEAEHNTFTDLVAQLTANCLTDLEKARAIFRWITVKDLNVMTFSDSIKQDTPLGLLRGIKFGTESYHTLFMRLCSYAGLVCREVKGHSKSVGYEPGMKIHSGNFINTWNVVLIGSDWWPVQSNWGARHLVTNKEQASQQYENQQSVRKSKDKIRYEYDEHYFLTDPDEFVMEFLAEDEEWQLLESPMNLSQFELMPFVRSAFFHNGLEFGEGSKNAVIETDTNGGAEIKINLPIDAKELTVFHYHLRFADREMRKETHFRGVDLERYVFHTITDQLALFSVHVPIPGKYFFEIFASRLDDESEYKKSKKDFKPLKLKCAVKYLLNCSSIVGKLYPLPGCAPGEWGPLKAIRYFGIQPITPRLGVVNVAEETTIKLQLLEWMQILVKLYFNGVERRALDEFLALKIDEDRVVTVFLKFPQKGQYGVDIYGQSEETGKDKTSLAHICKYLVNVTHVSNPISLPTVNQSLQRTPSVLSPSLVPVQLFELSYEGFEQTLDTNTVKVNDTIDNVYNLPEEENNTFNRYTLGPMNSQPLPPIPTFPDGTSSLQARSSTATAPGPTCLFKVFQLKTSSHKSASIEKFEKNGTFVTEFIKPAEVKLSARLVTTFGNDFTSLISMKDSGKKCKFSVSLPDYGTFILTISALNQHGQSQKMVDVYNYELNYRDPKNKNSSMKKK